MDFQQRTVRRHRFKCDISVSACTRKPTGITQLMRQHGESHISSTCCRDPQDARDRRQARTPLLPGLVRYIFTFPVMCRGSFALMFQQSDPHALLLLYHFYRAVRILLPTDECWWTYKRAAPSETVLKEWSIRESGRIPSEPTRPVRVT
jgi:hypothetical protein